LTLRRFFSNIAKTYDQVNFILTFGLDGLWRRVAAKECASSGVVLDLCCGSGKLSESISRSVAVRSLLVGVDFSKEMLSKALHQEKRNDRRRIFVLAEAGNLPFRDECIDCVGIAFSFRNLIYKNSRAGLHLKEILRVTRRGGKFVVVETSQPASYSLRIALHLYQGKIVPFIGGIISGDWSAYRYLADSSANFYSPENVGKMLLTHGFRTLSYNPLALGIACVHVSTK
jgi:demethylmenaquinone methyltransferase/2-methoxy-6-polyprenyl-1,4-benzoquinol methylase